MNIFVTGIGGFLGSHVARHLSNRHLVSGISTGKAQIPGIETVHFDALSRIATTADVVVHCHAAVASGKIELDAQTLKQGNVEATQKMLQRFPFAKHLYCSTVGVYASGQPTVKELSAVHPQNPYAASKLEAEQLILGMPQAAIVRFSSLYGPSMKENTLIPNYVNQALTNKVIEVWGSGERQQNYFHVTDAVALIEAIVQKDIWSHPVFLGVASREHANNEIAQLVASETAAQIKHLNQDASVSVHYDNSFTRNTLNLQPETDTAEAIKAYIQWKK